ncbi:Variant-specific surface protein, partial [Giardia duodenalis]
VWLEEPLRDWPCMSVQHVQGCHLCMKVSPGLMFPVIWCLIVNALAVACSDSQTNCAEGKCDTVGGTEICTQCQTGKVPINGQCIVAADAQSKCTDSAGTGVSDQTCAKCAGKTFMYKGGCYDIGQAPGNKICSDQASSGTDGVCTMCIKDNGFFRNPSAAVDKESCIACSDTAGADYNLGVANCKTCDPPGSAGSDGAPQTATCTACEDGYFVDSSANPKKCTACTAHCNKCSAAGDDQCTECVEGYFVGAANSSPGACVSCGDASGETWKGVDGCLKCTTSGAANTPATCTECQADRYFKEGPPVSCVTAETCNTGYFPNDDAGGKKKCLACSDNANGGIENCAECSLLPSTAEGSTVLVTCSSCSSDNLSPLKNECMQNCPAGTYAKDKVCTPCHASCSECADDAESSCTACYPGSVLNQGSTPGKGTCIPECTGKYSENCEADQCTAVLGGSKYCSKCKSGYVPVDGLCVSSGTTRAPPAGCTPGTDGTCSACTDTYFKESGGCYLSTAYPGKTLCSQASNGQCSQCANGQTQNNGVCPACDPTCATCETGKSQECKTCFSGYYFDVTNKVCKKCSENSADGKIQGVENCVSCAPPTTSGPVTCYVTQTPSVNPAGPSVNKGGLSSGAIAGISVAVIAVVGGLVGFLCWWFVCRGKA